MGKLLSNVHNQSVVICQSRSTSSISRHIYLSLFSDQSIYDASIASYNFYYFKRFGDYLIRYEESCMLERFQLIFIFSNRFFFILVTVISIYGNLLDKIKIN
jgi:hypothetical protein